MMVLGLADSDPTAAARPMDEDEVDGREESSD